MLSMSSKEADIIAAATALKPSDVAPKVVFNARATQLIAETMDHVNQIQANMIELREYWEDNHLIPLLATFTFVKGQVPLMRAFLKLIANNLSQDLATSRQYGKGHFSMFDLYFVLKTTKLINDACIDKQLSAAVSNDLRLGRLRMVDWITKTMDNFLMNMGFGDEPDLVADKAAKLASKRLVTQQDV